MPHQQSISSASSLPQGAQLTINSGSQSTISSSLASTNSSMELEETIPAEFDTNTFDLGSADLNELMKELNPEDFTKTIDQFSQDANPMEVTAADSNRHAEMASIVHGHPKVTIKTAGGEAVVQNVSSTIKVDNAPYCLVTRDGKHYLMKLKVAGNNTPSQLNVQDSTPPAGSQENSASLAEPGNVEDTKPKNVLETRKENKKSFKIVVKKEKHELQSTGGKDLKLLSKKSSTETKLSTSSSKKKEKSGSSSSGSSKSHRSKSSSSGKSAAQEAKEKEERHEAILREKIKQSKQMVKKRQKEAVAIKQHEKDQETLKVLNLGPAPSMKIPKIPKKQNSFADAIGIPGSGPVEKIVPVADKSSKEKGEKTPTTDVISPTTSVKDRNSPEKDSPKQRRHRMKVFNSKTSRSDDLLRDMTMTETVKNKASSNDNKNDSSSKVSVESTKSLIDSGKSSSSLKTGKRLSIEGTLEKPDAKKAKLSEEKVETDRIAAARKETADKKKAVIQESSLFMDTLNAGFGTAPKVVKRKRRTSSSGNEKETVLPLTKLGRSASSPNKKDVEKPVFNFYRDTLSEKEADVPMETTDTESIDRNEADPNFEETPEGEPGKLENSDEECAFVPGEDDGKLKSALCIHRSKGKPRKSVQWREEDELKEIYYFEMDETERVNVTKQPATTNNENVAIVSKFSQMKEKEKAQERVNLRKTGLTGDRMGETIGWKSLLRLSLPDDVSIPVVNSKEKMIQEEREKTILALFLPPGSLLPDSPLEPEVSDNTVIEREPT